MQAQAKTGDTVTVATYCLSTMPTTFLLCGLPCLLHSSFCPSEKFVQDGMLLSAIFTNEKLLLSNNLLTSLTDLDGYPFINKAKFTLILIY